MVCTPPIAITEEQLGVERAVSEFGHHTRLQRRAKALDDLWSSVMGHRPRRRRLGQGQVDGVGFRAPDIDRDDSRGHRRLAQEQDRRVGRRLYPTPTSSISTVMSQT